jgi:hypothetical protein
MLSMAIVFHRGVSVVATDRVQFAREVLRLARVRGLTFRIERPAGEEPILRVAPKERISPFLKGAIPAYKPELLKVLEREGTGYATAQDGTLWKQALHRCEKCGACDWGVIGVVDVKGEEVNHWGCLVCHGDETTLQESLDRQSLTMGRATPGTGKKKQAKKAV